jgi:hypothetical protein
MKHTNTHTHTHTDASDYISANNHKNVKREERNFQREGEKEEKNLDEGSISLSVPFDFSSCCFSASPLLKSEL